MDTALQDALFQSGANSTGGYFMNARRLKLSADRIEPPFPLPADLANTDSETMDLFPVYQMLLGYSFENLLKGLIIADGLATNPTNQLSSSLTIHELEKLADMLQAAGANGRAFSAEERAALAELTPYIVWGGRYHLPKKPEKVTALVIGSEAHQLRKTLWDRLSKDLKAVAWVEKMDGTRLYLVPRS